MSERRFDIVFDGSVINGSDPLAVKERVKQLFKLDDAAAEKLFSGSPIVIKKNVDRKTATQYQQAMSKAGARIQMVLHKDAATTGDGQSAPESANSGRPQNPPLASQNEPWNTQAGQATGGASENEWTLAAAGSLLEPVKTVADKPTEIDTSHLSLADSASANPFLDHLDRLPQDQGAYLPCYPIPEIESAPDLEVKTRAQIDEESAATEARLLESCGKLIEQLSGDFAVGAAGEDLLKPEEKRQAVEKDFDFSAYSINQN